MSSSQKQGWNDYVDGVPYDPCAGKEWQTGWITCWQSPKEKQTKVS